MCRTKETGKWAGLRLLDELERRLSARTWWIIKTGPDGRLLLSDSPVLPVTALGHAIRWLHLFDADTLVIAMPISAHIAVVSTDRPLLPISGTRDFALMLNRTTWAWADRYVMSSSEEHIREVEQQLDGYHDVDAGSPEWAGRKQGRRLARAQIIPVLRVREGRATARDREIVLELIARKAS